MTLIKDYGIYKFNYDKLTIRDIESGEVLNKKLKSLKKYVKPRSFLGYHYSLPKIEEIIVFLKKDRNIFKASYSNNLDKYNELVNGFDTTLVEPYSELEKEIHDISAKIEETLQAECYEKNRKSKKLHLLL